MVVFVILYGLEQRFSVEALLSFQVLNYFLIQQIWPLNYFEKFTRFVNDVRPFGLDIGRANVETVRFWLVNLVPWVLANLLNVDSLIGVGVKDLRDHIFGFLGQKVMEVVFGIKNFLVQV